MTRMRHAAMALAVAALLATIVAGPAGAITGKGVPDEDGHPMVGTLLFQRSDGFFSCTGTLLSSTVMLTAGHCTAENGETNLATWVTFVPEVDLAAIINRDKTVYPTIASFLDDPAHGWIRADVHPNPDWTDINAPGANTHDVGVAILRTAHPVSDYGLLPTLDQFGYLDTAKGAPSGRRLTVVGYGVQSMHPVFGQDDYTRYVGSVTLTNTSSSITRGFNFATTNAPGWGTGGSGTCFGDSGGPAFWGDTLTIAGIASFGITPKCTGVGFFYRTDISDTLDFVTPYLQ